MRLKTLRKERPAFENEGAVINGNRMDLSNSGHKQSKHRTNNTFALPTSLNIELSSLNMSPHEDTPELYANHHPQTLKRRAFPLSSPSQPTHVSTYQALEAAYLEHGIRIHLNSTNAAAVTQQNFTTENSNEKQTTNGIHRHKAFVNRNPSRSSSALHYSTIVNNTNQDSRPFSALLQISTEDVEQKNTHQISHTQPIESQNQLQLSKPLNNKYSLLSMASSQQSDHMTLPTQLTITNGRSSTATLINDDPDLEYMSSLLQTTNGDSFRDTIRRRAGLRGTFAVHRHPLSSATITTTSHPKLYEKSSISYSPTANHRSSLLRTSTIAVIPTTTTASSKKVEKDILRHASRIRTNQIKDSFLRHQNALRPQTSDYISSVSNSPTRIKHQTKQNQFLKSAKSMSLEPLELLLAPPYRSLQSPPPPARASSLSLYDSSDSNRNNHQENIKSSKKRIKSPKISFVESNKNTHDDATTNVSSNENLNSSSLNDERLTLMKTSPLDIITNNKTLQSSSIDSGCYDRSSSSGGDTHSVTSLSINQASSSLPSARLTSASTRRSNNSKRVSFEDQYKPTIITTATYV